MTRIAAVQPALGRAVLSVLALLGSAGPVRAQETLRLTVEVQAEGLPLAGADVSAGSVRGTTDGAGRATLRVLAGDHVVRVSAFGHAPYEGRVAVRGDTLVSIALEPEAVEEEGILVTSTRGERRIEDEPIRVEVLSQEEVEEKLLMTPGSIVMLLNETTGLRVQETSPSLGGANIRIQGLRGRYTQLLADGLPLYGGQAGSLGLLQIPPMDLRQVEVIKGAASALYGASALGGVVNLVSKRPEDDGVVLLNGTTRGGGDVLLWLARGDGERGFTLLGGVHGQPRTDVDGDAWTDIPSHRRISLRPRLFLGEGGSRAMITLGGMAEDRRGGCDDRAQRIETLRFDAGTTAQVLLSERLALDVRAAAVTASHDHRFDERRERDRHSTLFAEASLRGQAGAHLWTAGAALQRDGYDARDVDGFDYVYWTPGVFAQNELSLGSRFTLAGSARLDHHDAYGTFLSPRASVLARLAEPVSLRISAGSGWFAPTPFTEETEEVGLGSVVPIGDLEAERARSIAADVSVAVGGLETNVTLFGSAIEDAVAVVPEADGRARLINVDGTTRTHGTELLVRYRREPWGITASHTWLDATEPSPQGEGRRPVPLTPRHMAGLVAVYEEHGERRAGIEVYYTGRQHVDDNPWRTETEPYVIVGVLAEQRFGRVRAFVNLENLTDRRQTRYDPIVLPAPGPYGRRTTDTWAPLEGRVINGGVRVSF